MKTDVASLGCTRNDLPAVSSMWTIADPERKGGIRASSAPKSRPFVPALPASRRVAGEPQPRLTARATVGLTVASCPACPNVTVAEAGACSAAKRRSRTASRRSSNASRGT